MKHDQTFRQKSNPIRKYTYQIKKNKICTSFLFSLQNMRATHTHTHTHTHTSIKTMLQISRDVKHLLFKNFQKESLILAF